MKKEITILTSWCWKNIYEIDWSVEDYLVMQSQVKTEWENWFWSSKYREKIKFSNIATEKGKTLHLALPEPEIIRTDNQLKQDRINLEKIHKKFLEENKDYRIRKFLEKRKSILEQLAKEEKSFNLETTNSKVQQYLKSQVQ